MSCLKELSEEETITIEQIKARVLPLLKENPLLVEWFQQCFPSDRIADHPNESPIESLSFHKATEIGDDPNVFEYIPQSELVPDPVENPCHIRYINGSIYYGGRILLPAQLSFQVNSAIVEPPKATKHQTPNCESNCSTYKCVHEIKRYGDMKIRMHVDNDSHSLGSNSVNNCSDAAITPEPGKRKFLTLDFDWSNCFHFLETNEKPSFLLPQENSTIADVDSSLAGTSEPGPSTTSPLKHCTDIMLKAHAVRLNPTAHATELIRTSDLMDMLKSNNGDKLVITKKNL